MVSPLPAVRRCWSAPLGEVVWREKSDQTSPRRKQIRSEEQMSSKAPYNDERIICSMVHGMWQSRCLFTVVQLRVPEILSEATQGSMGIEDISRAAGCSSSDQLYKIMRVMSQWGVGVELPNKRFASNKVMEMLRRDTGPSMGTFVEYFNSDEYWLAMLSLPTAVKSGKPAFEAAHWMNVYQYDGEETFKYKKEKMSVNEHVVGSKERRQEFLGIHTTAMLTLSDLQIKDSEKLYSIYPWSTCGRIMELGGGEGRLLAEILSQPGCESLKGVLFDLPSIVKRSKHMFRRYGVSMERVTQEGGDFFKPFPQDLEVDTVITKGTLVSFTEEDVTTILKNCRGLFPVRGGRFLSLSPVAPEAGEQRFNETPTGLQNGFHAVHVMSHATGTWYTKTEWTELFEKLSPKAGFRLNNCFETNGEHGLYIWELVTV